MFTNFEQIESWIKDNNFAHWIITRNKPDEEKKNDIIVDSNFYTGDDADKIAMTKKYLVLNGGRGYAVGFRTPNTTVGGVVAEIRLEDETQPTQGIGMQQNIQPLNIGEIEDRVRKQVMSEIREQDYQKRLGELERREKEFDAEKQSALGAFVHMISPVAKVMMERKLLPKVAGIDADAPVEVAPMRVRRDHPEHEEPETPQVDAAEEAETQTPDQPEVFTDEEADALYSLCARWKAVEPDYIGFLTKIVEMAESGDAKYTMAKSFL